MSARYGLWGDVSDQFLTYGGLILTHDNPAEMAFLITGAKPRELPRGIPADHCLPLPLHPDLEGLSWPLRREEFRR
ncbi:MAG: hypothetical protein JWO67_834 [Streptosporangiaceae bacterium]|nr:hypothetical protein [Streptosporangiaceae bacterium]